MKINTTNLEESTTFKVDQRNFNLVEQVQKKTILIRLKNFYTCKFITNTTFLICYMIAFVQGMMSLKDVAINFLIKDKLKLNPTDKANITSLGYIPWMIKPLFGFTSDSLPLCGYRRKTYIIVFAFLTTVSYVSLYFFNTSYASILGFNCLINLGIAFCNVLGEALLVEGSNKKGFDQASTNVSNFFFIRAIGSLLGSLIGGLLLEVSVEENMFAICSAFTLTVFIGAFYMKEIRFKNKSIQKKQTEVFIHSDKRNVNLEMKKIGEYKDNVPDAIIVDLDRHHDKISPKQEDTCLGIESGEKEIHYDEFRTNERSFVDNQEDKDIQLKVHSDEENVDNVNDNDNNNDSSSNVPSDKFEDLNESAVTGVEIKDVNSSINQDSESKNEQSSDSNIEKQTINETSLETKAEGEASSNENDDETLNCMSQLKLLLTFVKQPYILWPIMFILLFMSMPSYSDAMFFFYTNKLGFSKTKIGSLNFMYGLSSLIGIFLYNTWLKKYSFKKIMVGSTIIYSILNLMTLALVQRWNLYLGIPDFLFCIANDSINTAIGEINTMPILVLACDMCPKKIEGTTYALLMSVFNIGNLLSVNSGAVLMSLLGINRDNFDNLWLLIIISNITAVIPLLLLKFVNLDELKKVREERIKQ